MRAQLQILKVNLIALVAILGFTTLMFTNLNAANRYWVASSTGNWNSTANWSTTSGGVSGASVPGSSDIAIFDGGKGYNGNCTINSTVSVAGIQMTTTTIASTVYNYSGTISKGSSSLTIGANGILVNYGTFNGGTSDFSCTGSVSLGGGTFISTTGIFSVSGNFTYSSGTFTHNNGTVNFNGGTTSITLSYQQTFYNLIINKTNATNDAYLSVRASDTVLVTNKMSILDGRIYYGYVKLYDSLYIDANADLNGSTITFCGNIDVNWNFSGTTINNGGKFVSTSKNLYMNGNLTNGGGLYKHNNGNLLYAGNVYTRTLDVNIQDTFYNVTINMNNGGNNSYLNIPNTDTIVVLNKLSLLDGRVGNGYTKIVDSLYIDANADQIFTSLSFTGNVNSDLVCPGNFNPNQTVFVKKTNSSNYLHIWNPGQTSVTLGTSSISILKGIVDFPSNPNVNWNFSTTNLSNGGFLKAPSTNLYMNGNYSNGGGRFLPNNGNLVFSGNPNARTLDCNVQDTFYNVTINMNNGSNTSYLSIPASDTMFVSNKLSILDGRVATGYTKILDTLYIDPNSDVNSSIISFVGNSNSHFVCPGTFQTNTSFNINKTLASNYVYISNPGNSSVTLGTSSFNINKGKVAFTNNLNVTWNFSATVLNPGGTFIAPNANFNLYGNYQNTGGRFVHNNGTLAYSGNAGVELWMLMFKIHSITLP